MELGTRLRETRQEKQLTQAQIAAPRYTHAYVSTIEAGRRTPSRAALEYFAERLGVEVEYLLTGRPPDLPGRLSVALQEARRDVSAGRFQVAEQAFRRIVRQAKKFGLSQLAAKAQCGIALSLERQDQLEQAVAAYDEALAMLESEPPTVTVDALAGKARCLHLLGDVRYTIHLLETRLRVLEKTGLTDPDALLRLHASLVGPYFEAGLYAKASFSAAEALRFATDATNKEQTANMHINVARILLHEGRPTQAEESLRRAEDLYRELELQTELGRCRLASGIVAAKQGNFDDARAALRQAEGVFAGGVSNVDRARALTQLARIERMSGRADDAIALLQSSLELLNDSDVSERAVAYRELGQCYVATDPVVAEKHLRTAIPLFERADEAVELASAYRILGDLLIAQGDSSGGCEAFRTGVLLVEERL